MQTINEWNVAEIQGMYGPVTISERILQKIWKEGDFEQENLKTLEGKAVKILSRGTWNFQEGPDFKNAEVEVDGQRLVGDVEIHFYSRDWIAHNHSNNINFKNVILHIVLFEPDVFELKKVRSYGGESIHTLFFLPLLSQDLESYVMEDVLLALEKRTHCDLASPLFDLAVYERRCLLESKARIRWRQKLRYAQERLKRFGWEVACHLCCLETLGYRRNRSPMIDLAMRFPLAAMAESGRSADFYFGFESEQWKLAGLRPANHPLRRIQQYLELLEANPYWPQSLRQQFGKRWFIPESEPSVFRKKNEMKGLRDTIEQKVLARCIGGTRLDTLMCDALLPLLGAQTENDLFSYWFHWYSGDIPDLLRDFLREAEIFDGKGYPACNGYNQGIIQYLIE